MKPDYISEEDWSSLHYFYKCGALHRWTKWEKVEATLRANQHPIILYLDTIKIAKKALSEIFEDPS